MAPEHPSEIETHVSGPMVSELADWASIWGDLMLTESVLESRRELTETPQNIFMRRALWEAALVSYARTVASGRRRSMEELVTNFSLDEKQVHDSILKWRNQHVAHRVDPGRERVAVRGLVQIGEPIVLGVRVHVHPVFGPEEEDSDLERTFRGLVNRVRNEIWETYMTPLKLKLISEWIAEADDDRFAAAPEFSNDRGVTFSLEI